MKSFKSIVRQNKSNENCIHAGIHSHEPIKEEAWQENDDLHHELTNHYKFKKSFNDMYSLDSHELHLSRYAHNSESINKWLWNRHHDNSATHGQAYNDVTNPMDKALESHKTPHEMMVYSGTPHDPRDLKNHEGIVHHPAYLSTSINEKHAASYARAHEKYKDGEVHRHTLHIHVPEDHHGAYVSHISEFPEEKEFIMPRGLNLKHHETITNSVPDPRKPDRTIHNHHHFMSIAGQHKMHTGYLGEEK